MKIYTEIVWSWDDEKGELVKNRQNLTITMAH